MYQDGTVSVPPPREPLPNVGIIAGGGALPIEVADALAAGGRTYHVAAIDGFVEATVEAHPHTRLGLGEVGRLVRTLLDNECRELVIAGQLNRPDFRKLGWDLGALRFAPALLSLTHGGDDSMLRRIVRFFENQGFRVRGAGEIAPQLVAQRGTITGQELNPAQHSAMVLAKKALADMSRFDIGQAAVATPEGVIAFEDGAGTARMLNGVSKQPSGSHDRVLVKLAKLGQELRIDAPTVGLDTVREARAAGVDAIVVEAGATLVVQRSEMIELASELGITIVATDGIGRPLAQSQNSAPSPTRLCDTLPSYVSDDVGFGDEVLQTLSRHVHPETSDLTAVVRQGYVVVLERDALANAHLDHRLGNLPRDWGVRLPWRRHGVLLIRCMGERCAIADLLRLVTRARTAGLGAVTVTFANGMGNRTTVDMTALDRLQSEARRIGIGLTIDQQADGTTT